MGILDWAMPVLDVAGNVATSLINADSVKKTNQQNLELQKQEWAREDSAVQRRMADLKAAGMNPILAGGDAASSSLAVRMGAPQYSNPEIGSSIERGIRANVAAQQMAVSKAELAAELPRLSFEAQIWEYLQRPENVFKLAQAEVEKRINDWRKSNADTSKAISDANNSALMGKLYEFQDESNKKYGPANSWFNMLRGALGGSGGLLDLFKSLK